MSEFEITVTQTLGLRNDKGRKFVPKEYLYQIENYNYDDVIGANRTLCPSVDYNMGGNAGVDGIFEFRYINSSSELVKESILIINGSIVKNAINSILSPTTIYTGLTAGHKCTFAVLNDKLFISNGYDDVLVYNGTLVKEMGSCYATNSGAAGDLEGDYYYAITYVIDGLETVLGTISNTVTTSSNSVTLTIPVGPEGTTERKIYRTEADGTDLKLVATLSDNTTTTYTDNTEDGSLGASIPATNSPAPKPQFITVMHEKLIGVKNSRRPNYLYYSETEIEILFNTIGVADVSGQGNDNTSLTGMAEDYNVLVVFSEKRIYTVDVSGSTATVKQTISNVGCYDGFSVSKVPQNDSFQGGIMFVSNEFDVRVFNGHLAVNLATSFDNLSTANFSSQLNSEELRNLISGTSLEGSFFDYKYHLIIGKVIYVYDLKIGGWTTYRFKTASYEPEYRKMGVINNVLFIGQKDSEIVEKMYQETQYRNEDLGSVIETPELLMDNQYKFWKELHIYYGNSGEVTVNLEITPDNISDFSQSASFSYKNDGFDPAYFNSTYFKTISNEDDYKVIHINLYARWLRFRITSNNRFNFRGYRLVGRTLTNKEV